MRRKGVLLTPIQIKYHSEKFQRKVFWRMVCLRDANRNVRLLWPAQLFVCKSYPISVEFIYKSLRRNNAKEEWIGRKRRSVCKSIIEARYRITSFVFFLI